jgi:hypothetical protein
MGSETVRLPPLNLSCGLRFAVLWNMGKEGFERKAPRSGRRVPSNCEREFKISVSNR